jgi:hypothetical protein
MRVFLVGCFGLAVALIFSISLIALAFDHSMSWMERVEVSAMIAVMIPAMVAVAVSLLAWRDGIAFRRAKKAVRRRLLTRIDVTDSEFCGSFPENGDLGLILEVRNAIATFFQVPVGKIHPDDSLSEDFAGQQLQPSLRLFLFHRVLAATRFVSAKSTVVAIPTSDRIDVFARDVLAIMQKLGPDREN